MNRPSTSRTRRVRTCSLLLLGLPLAAAVAQSPDLSEAVELLQKGRARPALKKFQELNRVAGGECVQCLLGIANAHSSLGELTGAASAATRIVELTTEPAALAAAETVLGFSHFMHPALNVPYPEYIPFVQRALPHFLRAYELDQGRTETIRWNLAAAREWLGEEDEANRLWSDLDAISQAEAGEMAAEGLRRGRALTRPKKTVDVPMEYLPRPRRLGVEGRVVLQSVLDEEGRVTRIRVLEGLRGLTGQAIVAVRQWRYEPARLEGEPVPILFGLTVNFELR